MINLFHAPSPSKAQQFKFPFICEFILPYYFVTREFSKFIPENGVETIRNSFSSSRKYIDNDITVSSDQTRRFAQAIHNGSHFPDVEDGKFHHGVVLAFLEELSGIFDWDRYEYSTLGKKDDDGRHSKLSWYAVILAQWMGGHGLNYIYESCHSI